MDVSTPEHPLWMLDWTCYTFGLLYVLYRFSTRIFNSGIPGIATDYPCGVWCRGLTTCLLYDSPLFGNLVWKDRGFGIIEKNFLHCFWLCCQIYIHIYLNVSQCDNTLFLFTLFSRLKVLYFFVYSGSRVLSFYIDVVLTLYIVVHVMQLLIISRTASLALGQSYNCSWGKGKSPNT